MKMKKETHNKGQQRYQDYWDRQMTNPEFRRAYEAEAAKKEVWLQLVEARKAAGLTQDQVAKRLGVSQAQVARIEKQGYDAYTLNTLRRYVEALGDDFTLEVRVRGPKLEENFAQVVMSR
jgi:DNA-binding XRE family transcriptional regulator